MKNTVLSELWETIKIAFAILFSYVFGQDVLTDFIPLLTNGEFLYATIFVGACAIVCSFYAIMYGIGAEIVTHLCKKLAGIMVR